MNEQTRAELLLEIRTAELDAVTDLLIKRQDVEAEERDEARAIIAEARVFIEENGYEPDGVSGGLYRILCRLPGLPVEAAVAS